MARKSKSEGLKRHLISGWTIFAAIAIGVASSLFTERIANWIPPAVAVWLCSFLFMLLFYPFQKRQKDGIPEFWLWAVYSAIMGVVSVVVFYVRGWMIDRTTLGSMAHKTWSIPNLFG